MTTLSTKDRLNNDDELLSIVEAAKKEAENVPIPEYMPNGLMTATVMILAGQILDLKGEINDLKKAG